MGKGKAQKGAETSPDSTPAATPPAADPVLPLAQDGQEPAPDVDPVPDFTPAPAADPIPAEVPTPAPAEEPTAPGVDVQPPSKASDETLDLNTPITMGQFYQSVHQVPRYLYQ